MNSESSAAILRLRMVHRDLADAGITDERILDAFMITPRENFVPPGTKLTAAYGNHPYPIGFGQTVSQPFIVAFMIQMLDIEAGDRILEIGTGSGYQTAILAAMGMEVITLELIPDLAITAMKTLKTVVPHSGIRSIVADGYYGWIPAAPYDGIIVSAAPVRIPEGLEEQLNPEGGRMVIPLGDWYQRLISVTRECDDLIMKKSLPVRFVPLVRTGWPLKGKSE